MNIINDFAEIAESYISESKNNPVYPSRESLKKMHELVEPFPENPMDASGVLSLLNAKGSRATVKSTGGRYFGFVC